MKNKKIIVVIAAVCLLVISVGYALFSSNLNISGAASASGEFDFTATCTPGFSSEVPVTIDHMLTEYMESTTSYTGFKKESGYTNDTCSVTGKDVYISAKLKYPGAMRLFTIKVTNTGSIPMEWSVEDTVWNSDDNNYLNTEPFAVYKEGSGENLNLTVSDLKLETNESAYIVIGFFWSQNDDTNSGKELSTTFKLSIPFVQSN